MTYFLLYLPIVGDLKQSVIFKFVSQVTKHYLAIFSQKKSSNLTPCIFCGKKINAIWRAKYDCPYGFCTSFKVIRQLCVINKPKFKLKSTFYEGMYIKTSCLKMCLTKFNVTDIKQDCHDIRFVTTQLSRPENFTVTAFPLPLY